MMTVQKPTTGTMIVYRNPDTKKFQIAKFGDEIVKAVPADFKDISEVRAWVQEQGGTVSERKFYPLIGGYCEISLPTDEQIQAEAHRVYGDLASLAVHARRFAKMRNDSKVYKDAKEGALERLRIIIEILENKE